jgi:hypothetical protein
MTNELLTSMIISRNPLDPMMLTLAGLSYLALGVSVFSLVAVIIRVVKRKSVRILANVNILTGTVYGFCSLATILWMIERVIEIVLGMEMRMKTDPSSVMSKMIIYYWTVPVTATRISVIVCGINFVIGLALYLKWKDPQKGGGEERL